MSPHFRRFLSHLFWSSNLGAYTFKVVTASWWNYCPYFYVPLYPSHFFVLKSILSDINTSISYSLKVHVTSLPFYERSTLVPAFINWKKAEEDFHFYEKCKKYKYHSLFILPHVIIQAACTLGSKSGLTNLPPQDLHSASQPQAPRASSCVREHLCFLLISSVYLLARYV